MALTHDDVREIFEIIDSSGPSEIQVETEGFSLHVLIGDDVAGASRPVPPTPRAPASSTAAPASSPAAPEGPASADAIPEHAATLTEGLATIESPMLGTFYRAESPGAAPFVEVGSEVEPDTVVCIIEVMKMMNSVTAGVTGRIAEICSENAQLVEFGEPLFRVEAE